MVVTCAPLHSMVRTVQERTAFPSMITVQPPQAPPSQDSLVPVRPRVSLSVKESASDGSTLPTPFPISNRCDCPLTVRFTRFVAEATDRGLLVLSLMISLHESWSLQSPANHG